LGNCGLISGAFSSDTTISTPVAINKGGTGQTTAQAALDALAAASGSLVQGDVFIVDASTNVVRLARGSDNQTMVMNGSNPNWETVAAAGGALELLDNQEVSEASETITYTPDSALTTADYSEIIVVLTFAPSASSPESLIELNNVTTGYHTDGAYIDVGGQTLVDLNNQSSATIGYDAEANRSNAALVHIHMADSDYTGTKSAIMLVSAMSGGSVFFSAGLQMNTTTEEISEIEVSLSSGDYQVGSKMAVYGRKRA